MAILKTSSKQLEIPRLIKESKEDGFLNMRYYGKIEVEGPDGTNIVIEHDWY